MFSWSRHVSDRATAASFTNWRFRDPEPTVTDPDFHETGEGDGGSGTDGGRAPRDGGGLVELDGAMAGITVPAYARMPLAGMALVGAGC